jgi:steroid 5-alpha reductase family enzyme
VYKYIRQIFSVFALTMIVLFAMRVSADAWSSLHWTIMAVSAVACVLVFSCFIYIFNYGYAIAALLNGTLIAALSQTPAGYILGFAIAAYGLRLLLFTWSRNRAESYASRMENVRKEDAKFPLPVKIALWLQCAFLYTFHLYGIIAAAQRGELSATVWAGVAIILLGLLTETLADAQKQAVKAVDSMAYASKGLYARWRHPNYTGEIIFQIGIIVVGLGAVAPVWGNLLAVTVAPLYIILLMIAECLRADDHMEQRYGDRDDFREYFGRSGSILPRL